MPVDGVFIGTPLMASREAATNSQVKRLLVETPGIEEGTWVRRGEVRGGMTSGLSQLHADIYEVANASAAIRNRFRTIAIPLIAFAAAKTSGAPNAAAFAIANAYPGGNCVIGRGWRSPE